MEIGTTDLPNVQFADPPSLSWHAHITVAPENVDKFLELLKPTIAKVAAEPECVLFQVFRDPSKPGKFMFIENWNATIGWLFEVQFKKPYYIPYITETTPMWLERKFECWEKLPGAEFATFKQINFE